jgi:hypothetical protein
MDFGQTLADVGLNVKARREAGLFCFYSIKLMVAGEG